MRRENAQQDLFQDAPVWWEGLTGRRRLFVEYYCADSACFLNAAAAFAKAYSKPGKGLADSSIQSNASRLLRERKVQDAIARLLRARQCREDSLNEFRMLELLRTLAFYNPNDIINRHGELAKPLAELGSLALCVAGIEKTKYGSKIKLYDRTKAMEMLGRYLDIIRSAESAASINPNVYLTEKEQEDLRREEQAALPAAAPEAEDAEYQVVGAE